MNGVIVLDIFDTLIQEVMEMSENERNESIGSYKGSCICQTCATYNECATEANENLFCVTGKSKRIVSQN